MRYKTLPFARKLWKTKLAVGIVVALVIGGTSSFSQGTGESAITTSQVITFLNRTINWYRQLAVQQQIATDPSDLIVVYDNRQTAAQVVRLAFDFARAESELAAKAGTPPQSQDNSSAQYQSLRQLQAKLDKQVQDTQSELDSDKQKAEVATGGKKRELQSQISELQGEVELTAARRDSVRSMVEFVSGAGAGSPGAGGTGLKAQIDALATSVPAASSTSSGGPNGSSPSSAASSTESPAMNRSTISGIWDLTADVFSLSSKIHTVESAIQQTSALAKASQELRAPLFKQMTDLSSQGDVLAKQADSANESELGQERLQLDALAKRFKQISAAVIPISKQGVLLESYQQNLTNWRDTIRNQYRDELRNLGARLGFLLLILLIVMAAAELWRRAVYRYVHDSRRRYQFLLLRRFVLWFMIAVIIAFAFASKLGSVVTFAGLITAGVAVALQNVILSIVGYFFLIGKYGIRVGDHVQIGGVTGEIIDVGLVRLHLMELGGFTEGPTGRVVAFSNSIVFQPTAGLFKQLPGINFAWHEITLTVPAAIDHAIAKDSLLKSVQAVLGDYKDEIERQSREIARTGITTSSDSLQPQVHLRFSAAGVEAVIRYPVDFQHASEIDERVSHELLKTVDRDSKQNPAASASVNIKLRTDLSASEAKT